MVKEKPSLRHIKLDRLDFWKEANVRKNDVLYGITDLITSVKKNGISVPLLVKQDSKVYRVFSGQQRLEAAKIAKLETVPCYVFKEISLRDAIVLSLSENVLRQAMTREDKSTAAVALLKLCNGIDEVAKIMGIAESTVRGYLRYEDIPQKLRDFRKNGLSGKQIEDIYVKFTDIEDAIDVARYLAKIQDKKKKYAYGVAIRKSVPTDKPHDIRKRAEKIEHVKQLKIYLDEDYYQTLSKVAFVRKRSDEEFATEIIQDWVDQ